MRISSSLWYKVPLAVDKNIRCVDVYSIYFFCCYGASEFLLSGPAMWLLGYSGWFRTFPDQKSLGTYMGI